MTTGPPWNSGGAEKRTLLAELHCGFSEKMENMPKKAGVFHDPAMVRGTIAGRSCRLADFADYPPKFPIFVGFDGGDQREVS